MHACINRALRAKNPGEHPPWLPKDAVFGVELAGIEPASKQGILMLSTRLSWLRFSSGGKTQATNHRLIC